MTDQPVCKTCQGGRCDVCTWTTHFDALRGALLGDPNRFKDIDRS